MDEGQLVCFPGNSTCSVAHREIGNSVCCALLTFSHINLLSNPHNHDQNLICCSPLNTKRNNFDELG